MSEIATDLVADIGGTNARFGVVREGHLEDVATFPCASYESPLDAIQAYLGNGDGHRPQRASIAVATPITGDRVTLTNFNWTFDVGEIRDTFGLDDVRLINDFTAQALALSAMEPSSDLRVLRPGKVKEGAPRAVVGPGTGLGVGGLVDVHGCGQALIPAEGGHRDLAVGTEREWQVKKRLLEKFSHVSCEHIVSGPGIVTLYSTLCEIDGEEPRFDDPGVIVEGSRDGQDRLAAETIDTWSAILGAVVGDLALVLGARGGIYITGGVLAKMGDAFRLDSFLNRFEQKGPISYYIEQIPIFHVIHPNPGLLGAGQAFTAQLPD